MASRQAIAAVGQAMLGVLEDACPKPEFAGARFDLFQAANFHSPLEEGISLYLYRVTVNTSRRSLPPRVNTTGLRFKPSLPVDLFYLLTPWARSAARQQRLLGWAMITLHDTPVLGSGVLNHYGSEANVFRPDEAVELFADTISVADMGVLWDVNKAGQQPSMVYVVRGLMIDSEQSMTESGPVAVRDFDYAKVLS